MAAGAAALRGRRPALVASRALRRQFVMSNRAVARDWPPSGASLQRGPFDWRARKTLMRHLDLQEQARMRTVQSFEAPKIRLGDEVEVRYELSRTQQTQAVFQGYCVEIRNRGLDSTVVLKNTYDGVGVTQGVPIFSPRILSLRVVQPVTATALHVSPRPITKDYRYRWHTYTKSQVDGANLSGLHKPGIRSLEPRIAARMRRLRRRFFAMRQAAGLPAYTFKAEAQVQRTRRLEVNAEINRRLWVYTHDAREALRRRQQRRRAKHSWGFFKILPAPDAATRELPSYHPLVLGNLPA